MGSDGKLGSGSAAVCCMCGDHGLLPELFRCDACSVRSQHTYVSYLFSVGAYV
uniref:PHD-type zinc finger plants domain-containing protein n=1 Tax=Aegilops tauschii subsp. strangulata TaxID=200361 RepID=A0A453IYT8_AEGTS